MSQTTLDATVRVSFDDTVATLLAILKKHGFTDARAVVLAQTFAETSLDGVYTHGLNRFPRFIDYVQKGYVHRHEEAVCVHSCGALEQWDGRLGPGITNALQCTDRAVELARSGGIGCVALANTNHWMRGGTYGWRAAKAGCVFIGWTNTIANMPAWGAVDAKLGNNPLVLAVPWEENAIVLDMAMSQFSYGGLEKYRLSKQLLPVPGGYDVNGELSHDPTAIVESQRVLPIGYWKGAGLSLVLDILATILSGGLSTADISRRSAEYALSQVFIAIDTERLASGSLRDTVGGIIADYRESHAASAESDVRYPGEGVLRQREANLRDGIPVDSRVWAEIQAL